MALDKEGTEKKTLVTHTLSQLSMVPTPHLESECSFSDVLANE